MIQSDKLAEKCSIDKKEKKNLMEEKGKKPNLTKGTLILRTVVALYLLYTVYQLMPSLKTATGKDLIFVVAAMVIFTAIAIPLAAFSVKALVKGEFVDPAAGTANETQEDPQESLDTADDNHDEADQESASDHNDEQDTAE